MIVRDVRYILDYYSEPCEFIKLKDDEVELRFNKYVYWWLSFDLEFLEEYFDLFNNGIPFAKSF